MTTSIPIRTIARIAYQAVIAATGDPESYRGFDAALPDDPTFDQDLFYEAEERDVQLCLDFPNATPKQIHALVRAGLEADGWEYAEKTDFRGKKHRIICSWEDLEEQGLGDQRDYGILVAVVKAAVAS